MKEMTRTDVLWSAAFAAALGIATAFAGFTVYLAATGDMRQAVPFMLMAFLAGFASTVMQVIWKPERFAQRSLVGFSLAGAFLLAGLGACFLAYGGWQAALAVWVCAALMVWAIAAVYRIAVAS